MDTNLEVGDDGAEIGSQSLSFFGYPESVGEQPAKIRNLVSEDQPLLLHGISAYLNSQRGMMVYPKPEVFHLRRPPEPPDPAPDFQLFFETSLQKIRRR
jgi:hypothetical protein